MTISKTFIRHALNESMVLSVFKPGFFSFFRPRLEISCTEINERIEKMCGKKMCISALIVAIIDLIIKEKRLTERNGPLYRPSLEGIVEENSGGHVKLFSLKTAA